MAHIEVTTRTNQNVFMTISQLLDLEFDNSRGNILFRGASGWTQLTPGTANQYLATRGNGADPIWVTVPSRYWTMTWLVGIGADAAPATGVDLLRIAPSRIDFVRADIVALTGPAGAALVVDIMKSTDGGANYVSLWATNPGDRPTIADGATVGSTTSFDTPTGTTGNLFRLDVISVGSGTAGQNITVTLSGTSP